MWRTLRRLILAVVVGVVAGLPGCWPVVKPLVGTGLTALLPLLGACAVPVASPATYTAPNQEASPKVSQQQTASPVINVNSPQSPTAPAPAPTSSPP